MKLKYLSYYTKKGNHRLRVFEELGKGVLRDITLDVAHAYGIGLTRKGAIDVKESVTEYVVCYLLTKDMQAIVSPL